MFSKMKVLFYHSKKRINQKGEAPIYCRVTVDQESCEISTGLFVGANYFNQGYVIAAHPQACVYNPKLDLMRTKLNAIHLDLEIKNQFITAQKVKEVFTHKPVKPLKFIEVIRELVATSQDFAKTKSTKQTYRIRGKNIEAILIQNRLQNLYCNQIDEKLLQFLEEKLLEKKYNHNYTNKHLFFIGQVLKLAIQKGFITKNVVEYHEKKKDQEKPIIALSKIELKKLEGHRFASERLRQVLDLYIFQCYTGFAYVDMCNFVPEKNIHLINKKLWIIENRAKTDSEALLPLFAKAKAILEKYNNRLPLISNQKYNAYLKEICEIVGITKNLTTHTARKTFGTVKINEGFTIESVSRMMGHKGIAITQRKYAQVSTVRIEKEMQQLKIK